MKQNINSVKSWIIIGSIFVSSVFGYGILKQKVDENCKTIDHIEIKLENMTKLLYKIDGKLSD